MRVRIVGTAALVGAAVLIFGLSHADATPPDPKTKKKQVDSQVRALKGDLESSSKRLVAADAAYRSVQAKMPAARAAVDTARSRLQSAQVRDAAMHERLAQAVAAERLAERKLRRVDSDIAHDRKTAGQMARAAYQGGPLQQLAVFMDAESPTDFAQRVAAVQSVLRSQNAALDRLRDVKAETTRRERMLAIRRTETTVQRVAAAQNLERTEGLERAAAAARAALQKLADERKAARATVEAERAADLARYQATLAEQQRLVELIRKAEAAEAAERARRARQGQPDPAPDISPGARLARPAQGPITSGFGMRYHPILHIYKLHTGTDFGVPSGTTVRAAAAGRVIEAGFNRAYGNRVVVSHGQVNGRSLVTTYNHLSRLGVHPGDRLSQGQPVGRSGSTGYSTGPHLHFEVLVGGDFQDPMRWLS